MKKISRILFLMLIYVSALSMFAFADVAPGGFIGVGLMCLALIIAIVIIAVVLIVKLISSFKNRK